MFCRQKRERTVCFGMSLAVRNSITKLTSFEIPTYPWWSPFIPPPPPPKKSHSFWDCRHLSFNWKGISQQCIKSNVKLPLAHVICSSGFHLKTSFHSNPHVTITGTFCFSEFRIAFSFYETRNNKTNFFSFTTRKKQCGQTLTSH